MGDYSKVGGQNADILRATINGQAYNEQPTSEISELLIELKDKIAQGGGGGGGTTNYNALSNKPQINGVTLEGAKTTGELGINIPTKTSEITNDSGFITNTVNNLTNYMKTSDINTALGTKADKSTTYTKTEVDNALSDKVNKETGKGLSENDFTNGLKSKLDNIEAFANINKINTIKVNGTPLTPDVNKAVNIALQLSNVVDNGNVIQGYDIIIETPHDAYDPAYKTYYGENGLSIMDHGDGRAMFSAGYLSLGYDEFTIDVNNGIVYIDSTIKNAIREALGINSVETMIQGWTAITPNTYSRLDISQAIADGKKKFTILVYARKSTNRQAIKLELTLIELEKILSKAQQNELTITRSCDGFTNANDIALCKQSVKQAYENNVALPGVLDIKYQIYEGGQAVTGLDNFEYCIYAE